ncbi:hypothetical protein ACTFIU_010157 [Dictyostelium citrinum]
MASIGIDLGTTNCCAGIWNNGRVEIIPNDQGNKTTRSCVSFNSRECIIGDDTMDQVTIFNVKSLIGRKYSDKIVQSDIQYLPFKVIQQNKNDSNGDKPLIQVEFKGETKTFSPEEISSMVLSRMKEFAEQYIGNHVSNAIITVPAYFSNSQREATKYACTLSNLNVQRIFNEPTAAAMAYGLHKRGIDDMNILVFDLGGVTLDISLLNVEEGIYEILYTTGDNHLGGVDFNDRLVYHFIKEFKSKYNKDIGDQRAISRLRNACERVKRTLSISNLASIEIDSLYDGIDFHSTITRTCFEELCSDLFQSCMNYVELILNKTKLDRTSIDVILLIGGSSHIPKVQRMMKDYFNGKEFCNSINPDQVIAYGATFHAGLISGKDPNFNQNLIFLNVVQLSIGIETAGGIMTTLVERNTLFSCRKKQIFSTQNDNQTNVLIKIYEGERALTKFNNLIGTIELTGIQPAPRGTPQIQVTFDVNMDGLLTVTAQDKTTKKVEIITITNTKDRLSKADIENMIEDGEKFKQQDQQQKENIQSDYYNTLESLKLLGSTPSAEIND